MMSCPYCYPPPHHYHPNPMIHGFTQPSVHLPVNQSSSFQSIPSRDDSSNPSSSRNEHQQQQEKTEREKYLEISRVIVVNESIQNLQMLLTYLKEKHKDLFRYLLDNPKKREQAELLISDCCAGDQLKKSLMN